MKHIEICCGSVEDVYQIKDLPIDSIELNSALYLGGLTPSPTTIRQCKAITNIPLYCMVRPVPGGFIYNDIEFKTMLEEAKDNLKAGADGLVFGCLNDDLTINIEQTKQLIKIAKDDDKQAIFHRAFDLCINPLEAYQQLIVLGIDRILTSGGQPKASAGIELLKQMHQISPDRFIIGSGITPDNVHLFKDFKAIHASCKILRTRINGNGIVQYDMVDENKEWSPSVDCVKQLIDRFKAK